MEKASIGRVIVKQPYRHKKIGIDLMKKAIEFLQNAGFLIIDISAQVYLLKFYEGLGFKSISEHYLEDDIPHVLMRLEKIN
jgi:ElaA protein